jgi:uncharacterized protein YciI
MTTNEETEMPYFAAMLQYGEDAVRRQEVRPSHREYLRKLLETGKLLQAGPYADDSGAIIVYEAADLSEVQELLTNDPFARNGIIQGAEIKEWNIVMSRGDS